MSNLYFDEESGYSKKNLRKIHVTIKSFPPPFFNHFSLSLNRKRTCDNESYVKETNYIHASAPGLLYTGDLDWCKCGHCKNEAREIDGLCCREVNAMFVASGSILPSSFYGQICSTISHTF